MTSKIRICRISEVKNSEKLDLHEILAGFISYSTLLPKRMEIGRCVLRTNAKSNSEILTMNFEPKFSLCLFDTMFSFLEIFLFCISVCLAWAQPFIAREGH